MKNVLLRLVADGIVFILLRKLTILADLVEAFLSYTM